MGSDRNAKPMSWSEAKSWRESVRADGRKVVFTNGVFDILHPGHIKLLEICRRHGDALILGLNTDASVRRIKDERRPVKDEEDRATILLGLRAVDAVVLFDEDTPAKLIEHLLPDVLVKGGDYSPGSVVGRDAVETAGGKVVIVPLVGEYSTSSTIETILELYGRPRD